MIKDFQPRLYQQTIFNTCTQKNTLVVLPTGMGKTNILLMLAAHRLKLYPGSKILVLAPTKPLLNQHIETFKKHLEYDNSLFAVFTGLIPPEKRAELWQEKKIIFSTPQGLENDLMSNRIDISDVSLVAFDEAHRATGDYSYNFIADFYDRNARHPRIVALTASPGSTLDKVKEVVTNLHISDIEVRAEEDPDVGQYMQKLDISYIPVSLAQESITILNHLKRCMRTKESELKDSGFAGKPLLSKSQMLMLQKELVSRMHSGERDFKTLKAVSLVAEIMKTHHAIELAETQGPEQLNKYFEKLKQEAASGKTKASKNLMNDADFRAAIYLSGNINEVSHPKLDKLIKIIKSNQGKAIVFANYRDTGSKIVRELTNNGFKAKLFVGQAKKSDTGMSQKEQKAVIEDFRRGAFDILVATSVAEEGLDIPNVDTVLFYEPVPSAIRSIQRKGRTARHSQGRVMILVTKDTKDIAYRWSAHYKEKKLKALMMTMKRELSMSLAKRQENHKLGDYMQQTIIFVDSREKSSSVVKELLNNNARITTKALEVGDYLLSDDVVVEYKTQEDFLQSLLDGRMFEQARQLKHYANPVIMIEGNNDIYALRNVHPNSIRGLVSSLIIDYGIPIVYTKDSIDSANYLLIMAKREQEHGSKPKHLHSKKPLTLQEQQEYLVSSLPGIGDMMAKPLLQAFKKPSSLFNASEQEIQKVSLIGPSKAAEIRKVLDTEYTA